MSILTSNRENMPSPGRVQLNLSVEPEIKEAFKDLCERENISLAAAIQDFMKRCIDSGNLPTSDSPSTQLAIPFTDREIKTLKTLAVSSVKEELEEIGDAISSLESENASLREELETLRAQVGNISLKKSTKR